MHGKNLLSGIGTFLIILTIGSSLFAGCTNKDIEECNLLAFVRKSLSCFIRKQALKDEEFLLEEDDFSFNSGLLIERNLESIPAEVLWEICYKLPPLDIIRLSLTSKNLRTKIDEVFWKSYLRIHNQERWDPFTPAVKVACALSFFKKRQIEKAAELGYPKAIEIVRKKESEKEARKWACSPYSYENSYTPCRYKYGRASKFYSKRWHSLGY